MKYLYNNDVGKNNLKLKKEKEVSMESSLKYDILDDRVVKLKGLLLLLAMLVVMIVIISFIFIDKTKFVIALINFVSGLIIAVVIQFFLIPKISSLEKIRDDFIINEKTLVYKNGTCKICEGRFSVLYPQEGGICDDCLVANYSLEEAREGLRGCHHIEVEKLYRNSEYKEFKRKNFS